VGGFETWSLKHAHVWGKPARAFEIYTNQPKECATFTTVQIMLRTTLLSNSCNCDPHMIVFNQRKNLNCSKTQKEMFERVNLVEEDNEQPLLLRNSHEIHERTKVPSDDTFIHTQLPM